MSETAKCPKCDAPEETIHHFLFECPAYDRPRWKHMDLPLGYSARDRRTLLSDPEAMKHLFRFVRATKRLKTHFGDIL
jgi:hypothetical protein